MGERTLIAKSGWYLEGVESNGRPWSTPIFSTPFIIGRNADCSLRVGAKGVSRRHAEIRVSDNNIFIKDLGSRNGTYVNLIPVSEARLNDRDLVHFGSQEFRLVRKAWGDISDDISDEAYPKLVPTDWKADHAQPLLELISGAHVSANFQPIVDAKTEKVFAYEALCRGLHEDLPHEPAHLLTLAAQSGLAVQCSEMFRSESVQRYASAQLSKLLFLNAHAEEVKLAGLILGLQRLIYANPGTNLVLEISESAGHDMQYRAELKSALEEMGVRLAYDDFSGDMKALQEIMMAPPDYLKFDNALIADLNKADDEHGLGIKRCIDYAHRFGVFAIAEGVETAEQADVCKALGFDLIQGYRFGIPVAKFG